MIDVGVFRRFREAKGGATLEQGAHGEDQLEPRQGCAHAEMDAASERDIGGADAVGREEVGLWIGRGIAVGPGKEKRHLIAAFEIVAVECDVLIDPAGEHMQRRVVAEDFFDRGFMDLAVARFEHGLDAIAHGVNRGFVAGIEEQDRGGDKLVGRELGPVFLGGDELAQKVVGRRTALLVDHLDDIGAEGIGRGHGLILDLAGAAGLIHRHHGVGPVEEVFGAVGGNAKEAADHQNRDRAGEGVEEVEGAGGGKPVDQLMGQLGDLGAEAGDTAAGEGAQDKAAQPRMGGRFEFEHRVGLDVVEGPEPRRNLRLALGRDLAPHAPVAQERGNGLMRDGTDLTILFPEKEIPARAGAVVEGIGVLHEGRIGRGLAEAKHGQSLAVRTDGLQLAFARGALQSWFMKRWAKGLIAGFSGYFAAVALLAGGVWWYGFGAALVQLESRARSDLALAADQLTSELQRYRELAVLLADHPAVSGLLAGDVGPTAASSLLLEVADKTGALDIAVVDSSGRDMARAQSVVAGSHIGKADFERAMDGALGVEHLYSEAFRRRAFNFAAPVFSPDGPVVGAVIVMADVEEVEAALRGDRPAVFFTDNRGIVFVSNRSELVFSARTGVSGGQLAPFVSYRESRQHGHTLWQVDGGRYLPSEALHLQQALPVIGLNGEVLLDVAPARQLAFLQSAATVALCLAFGALLFLVTERRRSLAKVNVALEERVARRTEELERANLDLRHEVAERTDAEARLKKAQADLVQAGKLSALGQMSAGISHELNQPLMAIRSFAENAETFLERGKPEMAAQNLSRISELARRMGRIIKNLRAFAKQESEPLSDVDLVAVVDAAIEMGTSKIGHAGVNLDWAAPSGAVMVRGGEVRLQQVVLNLISNAVDAMEETEDRRIEITLERKGPRVFLAVRDTGPGIAEPERIFDPFYTTKEIGSAEGMGLGLSISYGLVQSFGGQIRGRNHPENGAIFTVELAAVEGAQAA